MGTFKSKFGIYPFEYCGLGFMFSYTRGGLELQIRLIKVFARFLFYGGKK